MPVPLQPELAAWHATVVQGGYSTPAIEAFRILDDALRSVTRDVPLDERWTQGVIDTLAWLDEHAGPEVEREQHNFELTRRPPANWRALLEGAVA